MKQQKFNTRNLFFNVFLLLKIFIGDANNEKQIYKKNKMQI